MSAPTATRDSWKRLSPEERRAQLISIAEQLFQTRPYAEIGVVDVAKAAGITHGLIYHYFSSKEALFLAVFEAGAEELLERCAPDPALPLHAQTENGLRGYLDYVEEHRVSYLNLFRGVVVGNPELVRLCERTRRRIMDRMLDALGLSALPLPSTRLAMRGYVGFVESAVLDWLETHSIPRETLERLIYSALGAALRTGFSADGVTATEMQKALDEYDRYFGQR